VAGDKITFTNGPDSGQASTWLLIPHGRVTASGDTFTPGSDLNAAFNNYTIWELQNGYGLDAGGCLGDDNWQYACLNEIPNNYFVIESIGVNYYLVNVHASNMGYALNHFEDTPWLLSYRGTGVRAQYVEWDATSGAPQYPQLNMLPCTGIGSMTRVSGFRGFGRLAWSAGFAG
jgi:hypothetical protein